MVMLVIRRRLIVGASSTTSSPESDTTGTFHGCHLGRGWLGETALALDASNAAVKQARNDGNRRAPLLILRLPAVAVDRNQRLLQQYGSTAVTVCLPA